MIVYLSRNKQEGKVYVGQTIRGLDERRSEHLKSVELARTYFSQALRKYGPDAFEWTVIDRGWSTEDLNVKERWWIGFYESFDPRFGYNLTFGGEGGSPTAETRRRIGDANRGKRRSEIVRLRLSQIHLGEKNHNFGKEVSEITKQKLSAALKGRHPTEEQRRKMSDSQKKRPKRGPVSDEQKRKQSEKMKGRYSGEKNLMYGVHRFGESAPHFGRRASEESLRRMRLAQQRRWDPGRVR